MVSSAAFKIEPTVTPPIKVPLPTINPADPASLNAYNAVNSPVAKSALNTENVITPASKRISATASGNKDKAAPINVKIPMYPLHKQKITLSLR